MWWEAIGKALWQREEAGMWRLCWQAGGMEGWQRAILARSIDPGGLSTCLCCGEDGLGPGVEGVVNMGWVWWGESYRPKALTQSGWSLPSLRPPAREHTLNMWRVAVSYCELMCELLRVSWPAPSSQKTQAQTWIFDVIDAVNSRACSCNYTTLFFIQFLSPVALEFFLMLFLVLPESLHPVFSVL